MQQKITISQYFSDFNHFLDLYFPTLEEMERWMFWSALCRSDFVHKDAAILLGITPRVFCYHMKANRKYWQELIQEDLNKCELP